MDKGLEELIRRHALENAVQFGGNANAGSVMGRVLAARPELKSNVRELKQLIDRITGEVNALSPQERQKALSEIPSTEKTGNQAEKAERRERKLPPLPNVDKYPVVHVRFSPNPDGALHLGGSRAAILCDEYAKMYNGKFTLRFDDTDPRTKSPIPEAYGWIVEDMKWLGANWQDTVYQSDRLEIYYKYAKKLIEMGAAYICTCEPAEFKKLILASKPCQCRDLPPEEHLSRWSGMLEGRIREGEAVVRIKTDLNYPNPAVRDWPALRAIDVDRFPHPRTGSKYRVWPLFAFCCGIDDHELGVSHVIRGKEHLTNSVREEFLYRYLGWEKQEAIHYGRFKIIGSVLAKSKIREGIAKGQFSGWDDPRLGTLKAMRRRGFLPETVRQLIIEVGPKPIDASLNWDNVQALNRKLLDPVVNRYYFVAEPTQLIVDGVQGEHVAKPLLHPGDPARGNRTLEVKPEDGRVTLMVSGSDLDLLKPGNTVRLMSLFNVTVQRVRSCAEAVYHSESHEEAREAGAPLMHWVPCNANVEMSVVMPDATTVSGVAEEACGALRVNDIVQFERFGFARIDNTSNGIVAYYAHR